MVRGNPEKELRTPLNSSSCDIFSQLRALNLLINEF